MGLRRSTRRHNTASESAGPSGSEYHESDKSGDMGEPVPEPEPSPPPPVVEYSVTQRGRKIAKKSYKESASEDDMLQADDLFNDDNVEEVKPLTRRGKGRSSYDDDEEDDGNTGFLRRSTRGGNKLKGFVVSDDEGGATVSRYSTRSRTKKPPVRTSAPPRSTPNKGRSTGASQRARRLSRRNARQDQDDGDVYVHETSSGASVDADGSFDDAPHTSSDADADADADGEIEIEQEPEGDGRPYALRQRAKINYAIPPPLEEMPKPPPKRTGGGGRNGYGGGAKGKGRSLGWSATGAELGRWMGMPGAGDDSVSIFNCPYL